MLVEYAIIGELTWGYAGIYLHRESSFCYLAIAVINSSIVRSVIALLML